MKPLSSRAQAVTASTTLRIDAQYKKMLAEGKDVVGFGAGEPDFNTPAHIKDAGVAAISADKTRYTPAAGTEELRKAICGKLKRDNNLDYAPSQVVVSSGGKHMLYLAFACLLNPGDEVILPAPYWVSYEEQIRLCGGVPVFVQCDKNFQLDPAAVVNAITERTKVLLINSPSNPTGAIIPRETLQLLASVCIANDLYVISDEIYDKLVYDGEFCSIAALPNMQERTIVINGVSKTYAMTGWRIGYAAANQELATVMANYQSHSTSSPSTISQSAAAAALNGDQSCVAAQRKVFKTRRDLFMQLAADIPRVTVVRPKGAFYVMMSIADFVGTEIYGRLIKSADDFAEVLLDKAGVAVVPCAGFGAPNHLRWSYATSEENIIKGLSRLKTFIAQIDAPV